MRIWKIFGNMTMSFQMDLLGTLVVPVLQYASDIWVRALPLNNRNIMTNDIAAQQWLAEHVWEQTGTKIAIDTDCRDIGAHICLANTS